MDARTYAEALYRATNDKSSDNAERNAERFIELVRTRGHEKLLPRIVREYERHVARRHASHGATLRIARTADREKYASSIASDRQQLATDHEPTVVIDDTVIGGYELRAKGESIDRTYKRKLLALFETLKR